MSAGHPSQTNPLVASFQNGTLPKADWTHEAHLRVGLWHVLNFSAETALQRLREGIIRLNAMHGTPNTHTSGYHETITRFYVALIARFVAECNRKRPLNDLAAELIARYGHRDLPLRYYSRALLDSVSARHGWVEPDLLPLE